MIREYENFFLMDGSLTKNMEDEIKDIIENEPTEDGVKSIMNLIYDVRYEW